MFIGTHRRIGTSSRLKVPAEIELRQCKVALKLTHGRVCLNQVFLDLDRPFIGCLRFLQTTRPAEPEAKDVFNLFEGSLVRDVGGVRLRERRRIWRPAECGQTLFSPPDPGEHYAGVVVNDRDGPLRAGIDGIGLGPRLLGRSRALKFRQRFGCFPSTCQLAGTAIMAGP